MTDTVALDRIALEQRLEALSSQIPATTDVLRRLDLVQQRCELRSLIASLRSPVLRAVG
jgi:hypothetical protein